MDRMSLALMIATLFFRMVVEPAEPAAPTASHPHMATQAMMLAIADGTLPLARFIDGRVGVVLIYHSPDPSFGASGSRRARPKRFCGKELMALVARWQARMAVEHDGVRSAYEESMLECHNRPSPPTCTFGRSMEWDPAVHFIFQLDPERGLRLRAITLDDEALVDPREIAAEHRAQAKTIERLTPTECPSGT